MASVDPIAGGLAGANHSRVKGLDGLRGCAAFAILGHHVEAMRHHGGAFAHAYLAVDFFFLLSGFVIGVAYEPRLASGLTVLSYARARLIRLYPMIVLGALIGGAAGLLIGVDYPVWASMALQLAFVPFTVTRIEAYPLNGVQWSLFFEIFINAVHAVLRRFLTTPRLAGIVALSAIWLVVTDLKYGDLNIGFKWIDFAGGFPRVIFSFAAGLLIYRLWRLKRLPSLKVPYLAVTAVLALALTLPAVPVCRDWVFAIAVFPAILILALNSHAPGGVAGKVVAWAGVISYPLYAVHLPLLRIAAFFAPRTSDGLTRAIYWIFTVATVLALASVIERIYDAPIRRWLQGHRALATKTHGAVRAQPPS